MTLDQLLLNEVRKIDLNGVIITAVMTQPEMIEITFEMPPAVVKFVVDHNYQFQVAMVNYGTTKYTDLQHLTHFNSVAVHILEQTKIIDVRRALEAQMMNPYSDLVPPVPPPPIQLIQPIQSSFMQPPQPIQQPFVQPPPIQPPFVQPSQPVQQPFVQPLQPVPPPIGSMMNNGPQNDAEKARLAALLAREKRIRDFEIQLDQKEEEIKKQEQILYRTESAIIAQRDLAEERARERKVERMKKVGKVFNKKTD